MAQDNPIFANLQSLESSLEGVRLLPAQKNGNLFPQDWLERWEKKPPSPDVLELLLVDWTFGTEELSSYSKHIQQVEKAPCLFMHPKDAAKAGLSDGDRVTLHLDGGGGPLETNVSIAENMATGVMILPRHRQLSWQRLKTFPVRIPFDRIKKS